MPEREIIILGGAKRATTNLLAACGGMGRSSSQEWGLPGWWFLADEVAGYANCWKKRHLTHKNPKAHSNICFYVI